MIASPLNALVAAAALLRWRDRHSATQPRERQPVSRRVPSERDTPVGWTAPCPATGENSSNSSRSVALLIAHALSRPPLFGFGAKPPVELDGVDADRPVDPVGRQNPGGDQSVDGAAMELQPCGDLVRREPLLDC